MSAPVVSAPPVAAAGLRVDIVDDDPAIRDSLAFLFRSCALATREWDSGEAFLAEPLGSQTGCVVLDVRMSGLSGLSVFDRLCRDHPGLPVVFLTGHAEVPVAVDLVKRGAFDFVEKPFNDNALVAIVRAAIGIVQARRAASRAQDEVRARLAGLTAREREVLGLLLEGAANKQIAHRLGITIRTVEVHRAHVFEKAGVRNAIGLAALLAGLGA